MRQQAYDPKFPQTPVGSLYPVNYVVGVIDDLQEAQRAEQAFKDAGYDANTTRLMESHEAITKIQELEHNRNPIQRFLSSFQATTDETGADIYRFEARQGHHILYVRACSTYVRACSPKEVAQICDLMERFHAHIVKFFSFWAVEDIPPKSVQKH
jgi:hypothetical protein